jgi:predicted GIY-YIG superfamily endonuclease
MGKCSKNHQLACNKCDEYWKEHHKISKLNFERAEEEEEAPRRQGHTIEEQAHTNDDNHTVVDNGGELGGENAHGVSLQADPDQSVSMLHHKLIQTAKKTLTLEEKPGYLYIFRCSDHPGLIKLGYSTNVSKRGKQHRRCKLVPEWIEITNRVEHMKRAEELAKVDMEHLKKAWKCSSCGEMHTEWFEVSAEVAKGVVKKWVTWINEQLPYDEPTQCNDDGQPKRPKPLKPLWSWLIDRKRVPQSDFENDDHEARWKHWDFVLSKPTPDEKHEYRKVEIKRLGKEVDKTSVKTLPVRQQTSSAQQGEIIAHNSTVIQREANRFVGVKMSRNTITAQEIHIHLINPDAKNGSTSAWK